MRESFVAATNILEERYLNSRPKPEADGVTRLFDTPREVRMSFNKLRSDVDLLFPNDLGSDPLRGDVAIELARFPDQLDRLTTALSGRFKGAPAEFTELLREHFSEAFRFAFTEIGLKRN